MKNPWGKAKIAAGGYEIGRWYAKVRDAIGPDGLARVKAEIHSTAPRSASGGSNLP